MRREWSLFTALLFLTITLEAAPMRDMEMEFAQPDGTLVPVIVNGDEYFQEVTTPEGVLLIRDDEGWICYAEVASDGSDYISTGVRYGILNEKGVIVPPPPPSANRPRTLSPEARSKKVKSALEAMYPNGRDWPDVEKKSPIPSDDGTTTAPPLAEPETIKGITILFDFPDQQSSVTRQGMENLMNQVGYAQGRNNGSVRDYYHEVSNGRITYLNEVSDFVRSNNPKSSYDNGSVTYNSPSGKQLIHALLKEVLQKAVQSGSVDISQLSTDRNGYVRGVNFFYAGSPTAGWSYGLWPHQWQFDQAVDIGGGKRVLRYQMTNIGNTPTIGTVVHENGHLLFAWPDLYHYNGETNGAGDYCVMSTSATTNPVYPNPYFRLLQGWVDTVDFAGHTKGRTYTLHDTSTTLYAYSGRTKGSTKELFLFEVKHQSGRNSKLPDGGLAIWHIDQNGDNTTSKPMNQNGPFDLANIEQADGRFDLERKATAGGRPNMGDATDLFDHLTPNFNDQTSPSASWHNRTNSQIDIRAISAAGKMMTFSYGEADPRPYLTINRGEGSGLYEVGEEVTIEAEAPELGFAFQEWSGKLEDLQLLDNRNAATTQLMMPDRDVELTALFRELPPDGILMPKTLGERIELERDTLFYDDGWIRDYSAMYEGELTLAPQIPGEIIGLNFLEFSIEAPSYYQGRMTNWDSLSIWNGGAESDDLLGTYRGEIGPKETIWSTAIDGSLTIRFHSDEAATGPGWKAEVLVDNTHTLKKESAELGSGIKVHWHNGKVHFALTSPTRIEASLHTLDGKRWWHFAEREFESGVQSISVPLKDFPKGHYWLRLQLGEENLRFELAH